MSFKAIMNRLEYESSLYNGKFVRWFHNEDAEIIKEFGEKDFFAEILNVLKKKMLDLHVFDILLRSITKYRNKELESTLRELIVINMNFPYKLWCLADSISNLGVGNYGDLLEEALDKHYYHKLENNQFCPILPPDGGVSPMAAIIRAIGAIGYINCYDKIKKIAITQEKYEPFIGMAAKEALKKLNKSKLNQKSNEISNRSIPVKIINSDKPTKVVYVNPKELIPHSPRGHDFSKEFIESTKFLHRTLYEVSPSSFKKWLDDFDRDAHPEKELAIWLHIARVYKEAIKKFPNRLDIKKEIFHVILSSSMGDKNYVFSQNKPKNLSTKDVESIIYLYKMIREEP